MSFEIFTVDAIAGRFQVAVKAHKDAFPGDSRSDAWKIVEARWGRGARLLRDAIKARRLTAKFEEDPTARGWGYVARATHPEAPPAHE
jgi:hypothetical protein